MPQRSLRTIAVALISLLSACSGGGGGGNPPVNPSFPATVQVVITQPLTDTGINVAAGKQLTVTATGMVNYETYKCSTGSCEVTPAGLPVSACSSLKGFTAPTLACWSLIGKIGPNGTPFEVGTSLTITAGATGDLYLGINDNLFTDNTGGWTAVINEI